MNMADAHARVTRGLGVCITSTGTAAGSPVLHITTQVDRPFVDHDRAAIHDVPRQPEILRAISKQYIRAWEPANATDALLAAARAALAAPAGPVTYEIPVDVQRARVLVRPVAGRPGHRGAAPDPAALDALAAPCPAMIELDMLAIGPFAESFADPPAGAVGSVR